MHSQFRFLLAVAILLAALPAALLAAKPADILVRAKTIVTMDAARRVIPDGAMAVAGSRILAVGPRAEVEAAYTAERTLDYPEGILIPGLLNTHTHAPMSLFRGLADDRTLDDWLQNFIFPAEARNVTPQFVYWGTRLAAAEMLLSGTTLFVDMYYFEEEVARAAADAGIRAIAGQTIIQFPVPDAKTPRDGLARAELFLKRYAGHPLVVPAVAPHALYTNDEATIRACRALADLHGVPLIIHLSETRKEQADMQAKYGKSPAAVLSGWGVFEGRVIAAHGVWLSNADLDLMRDKPVGIVHNPGSNMMLASGVAPLGEARKRGIPVGLGTDGPAGSNNDFNLFEEMDLAAKLQKVSRMDPTALSAPEAFAMATIEGARAIGMEKEIGSLETDKRADWVVMDATALNATPMFDVYSHLVYAFKGANVKDVMVNGVLLVREGRLLNDVRRELREKAAEAKRLTHLSLQK
ncbi:MAG: amidohydrolase [Bryobacterales bacterium]|nr:amidohydrolase [Bryobacterales bacterium]